MASFYIHLAIAKRYVEKNNIKNPTEFFDGNVLPDIYKDKENTHYGNRGESKDLIKRHLEKIGLKEFLAKNSLDNDINRGKFLHLYTDWEYYNNLLPKDYVQSIIDLNDFRLDLIYTGKYYNEYLVEKYCLTLDVISVKKELEEILDKWTIEDNKTFGPNGPQGRLQFTAQELDDFIERMSSVDLDVLATQIE